VTKDAILDMACTEDGSAIILGGQDNAVTAVDQYGKTHWTYTTGNNWAGAVGVSKDASVIAAGAGDGTVYVLDHGGSLLIKRDLKAIIQPRSLAVSRDGSRIVVADQYRLHGLGVLGDSVQENLVIYTPTPLNPAARYTTAEITRNPAVTPVLTLPVTEETPGVPESPAPTPAQKSPAGPLAGILAIASLALILAKAKK
jgi:WD40 repeat protein